MHKEKRKSCLAYIDNHGCLLVQKKCVGDATLHVLSRDVEAPGPLSFQQQQVQWGLLRLYEKEYQRLCELSSILVMPFLSVIWQCI
jgi:hypothetical protein